MEHNLSLLDFIGFIIALLAMLFLFIKRFIEENKRRSLPRDDVGQTLEEFLESQRRLDTIEMEEKQQLPKKSNKQSLQQPLVRLNLPHAEGQKRESKGFSSFDSIQDQKLVLQKPISSAESYEVIKRKRSSRGLSLIKSMKNPQDMFVLKEILEPPLSLRSTREKP